MMGMNEGNIISPVIAKTMSEPDVPQVSTVQVLQAAAHSHVFSFHDEDVFRMRN